MNRLKTWEPVARRVALCAALYAVPLIAMNRAVLDPDIWWHLRTGQWIFDHARVPSTDPFSTFGSGRPWAAYSWLFEIVAYGLFRTLGLVGIWLFRAGMIYAVAIALHRLIVKREPAFVRAIGLLALAFVALLPIGSERPWHFTILFSIATLATIEVIRQRRRPWSLWLLPLAFALWANVHIQFVVGLAFLGLAALFGLIEDFFLRHFQPTADRGHALPGHPVLRLSARDWHQSLRIRRIQGRPRICEPFIRLQHHPGTSRA